MGRDLSTDSWCTHARVHTHTQAHRGGGRKRGRGEGEERGGEEERRWGGDRVGVKNDYGAVLSAYECSGVVNLIFLSLISHLQNMSGDWHAGKKNGRVCCYTSIEPSIDPCLEHYTLCAHLSLKLKSEEDSSTSFCGMPTSIIVLFFLLFRANMTVSFFHNTRKHQ